MSHPAFKAGSGRITPSAAGSIPALSAIKTTMHKPVQKMRSMPAVGKVIVHPALASLTERYGHEFVTQIIRSEMEVLRSNADAPSCDIEFVCQRVVERIERLTAPALVRVLNATGVVIHTNLGRAPLSPTTARHISDVAAGYCNLEFDLERGKRGDRQSRLRELLSAIIGAEDALVVNNNAAAVFLMLKRFASRKEVIVSRGELVEIGDSFRLPDIMRESGAKLVEVGTTNRTRIADYEHAITEKTSMLLKVHRSNFLMKGFVEDTSIEDIAGLAHERGLIAAYDLGSGLLIRPAELPLMDEPTVKDVIGAGADLVTFSGDKLLGGVQAGLIVGRRKSIAELAKAPLMRALRPGKLTMVAIEDLVLQYIDRKRLSHENPVFRMIGRDLVDLRAAAESLASLLRDGGADARIVKSDGQVGGGAMPGLMLPGWAVEVVPPVKGRNTARRYCETLFAALLRHSPPVLGILREGKFMLDVRTLDNDDLNTVADAVINSCMNCDGGSPKTSNPLRGACSPRGRRGR